jgi:hypothetical protein
VQIALLRSDKTPIGRMKELEKNFTEQFLREIVAESTRAKSTPESPDSL